jgi:2-polyprenyl-3-methyl-5-hydroxy-6-metoxy-1,4-benzoquinol methylase
MNSIYKILFRGEDLEKYIKFRTVTHDNCIACGSNEYVNWAISGSYKAVKCSSCGLIWMHQILNEEGLKVYYSDYIGRRRLNNELKMKQREIQYEIDAAFIERYIKSGKVLDVGCSGGFFLSSLDNKFSKHGVEIDSDAVAFAKKSQKEFGSNITCGVLNDLSYKNSTFDLITMRGAIEHVSDPVNSIEKVSNLLNKGGYYYITATPNGDSYSAGLYREQWTLFHPVQHIWHFSPKTLSSICEKFNLKLIATEYPYLGTPYEDVKENIKSVEAAIRQKENDPDKELPISPPFWENMMSLVFVKV